MKNLKREIKREGLSLVEFGQKMYPKKKCKTPKERKYMSQQVQQLSHVNTDKILRASDILNTDPNTLIGYDKS